MSNEAEPSLELEDSLEPPLKSQLSAPAMGNAQCHSGLSAEVSRHDAAAHANTILQQLADDDDVPYVDDEDSWRMPNVVATKSIRQQLQQQLEVQEASESVVDDEQDDSHPPPPPYEGSVHFFEDGHCWWEVPGLPPEDTPGPDISLFNGDIEMRKRLIHVRFTSNPIKGNLPHPPLLKSTYPDLFHLARLIVVIELLMP